MKMNTFAALTVGVALVIFGSVQPKAQAEPAPTPSPATSTAVEQDFFDDAFAVCTADLRSWGDDNKVAAAATPETTTLVKLSEVHAVMYGTTPVGTWICTMMISEGHPDGPYTESLPLTSESDEG